MFYDINTDLFKDLISHTLIFKMSIAPFTFILIKNNI